VNRKKSFLLVCSSSTRYAPSTDYVVASIMANICTKSDMRFLCLLHMRSTVDLFGFSLQSIECRQEEKRRNLATVRHFKGHTQYNTIQYNASYCARSCNEHPATCSTIVHTQYMNNTIGLLRGTVGRTSVSDRRTFAVLRSTCG